MPEVELILRCECVGSGNSFENEDKCTTIGKMNRSIYIRISPQFNQQLANSYTLSECHLFNNLMIIWYVWYAIHPMIGRQANVMTTTDKHQIDRKMRLSN